MARFTYTIDLDERGSFRAHVDNPQGREVFSILAGDELEPDESSIFEDGYMKHSRDISGLQEYLQDLQIINKDDVIE